LAGFFLQQLDRRIATLSADRVSVDALFDQFNSIC